MCKAGVALEMHQSQRVLIASAGTDDVMVSWVVVGILTHVLR